MTDEIFAVFDMTAQRYLEPFFAVNIATALRSFERACRQEGSPFMEFPEDYALYHIGGWNPETGDIQPGQPHKVGMANSFASPLELKLEGTTDA